MTARERGIGRRRGRPGSEVRRLGERLRPDKRAVLAVCLTAVMLLSVLAVPVAGAPPDKAGSGNGDGGGNGNSAGSSSGENSNAGGSSEAKGSSGNGNTGSSGQGGSSGQAGDVSPNGNSGNNNAAGSNGNVGNSNAGGNGNAGGNSAGAASNGNDGNPNAAGNGPPEDAGRPDHSSPSNGQGSADERGPPPQANAGGNGNGPTVSVSAGPPDDPGNSNGQGPPDAPPGQSGDRGPSSVVDVAVGGAQSGDEVNIDTSPPEVEDDEVAFDGVSVRVKRDGDFTMRVTNSREPLAGSPAFEPEEAAEALGRIRLEHSITNEEVEDVAFTFRVSKERLRTTRTDAEEVALYRFADGGWTALSTDVVGESATHYVFEADSPGMSEFAVGAKRPAFETHWADVEGDAAAGEDVAVSGRISNVGAADGVYEASLVVDGEVVSTRQVTIAAGGTRQVNFRPSFSEAGTYEVAVDDVSAGSVTVGGGAGSESASVDQSLVVGFEWILEVSRTIRTAGLWSTAGL